MASELKVNTIKKASGSTITVGESGDTVTLASGAVVSGGFKDIQWQSVITADGSTTTTAEAGKGYFIDNSSAIHTINLPASPSIGDVVKIVCLGNASTYNVTVGRNSSNIQGAAEDRILNNKNQAETFVYSNATEGWVVEATTADLPTYISATGGTATTSGDYKIHTFTSSGCFVVSCTGNQGAKASYLVVAGGAGGGGDAGGGGGAGGYREGKDSSDSFTASPLATTHLTLTAQTYPVTVGGGGTAGTAPSSPGHSGPVTNGGAGSNSVFSTITSAGGGYGGKLVTAGGNGGAGGGVGVDNGSGGGGPTGTSLAGGSGNTPPVSPSQGNDGGDNFTPRAGDGNGGGGGGATGQGGYSVHPSQPQWPTYSPTRGDGGTGATTSISGSPTAYAGGGAGGQGGSGPSPVGTSTGSSCGTGGVASPGNDGGDGTTNRGGGGAGGAGGNKGGGQGGSGIVIIRYRYQ